MAKLIGAVKFVGKFNDAVGMRSRRGKSFVRSAAASVANPRSIGQSIQRMILATAGQSIGYLKEICNNSVEGKANGNDTLSYLRSQWMGMLRVSDINSSPYNYAKKGSSIFIENPYQLSKGSLYVPQYSCDGSTSSLLCAEINDNATKASELFPSIAVGNQITIVAVGSDDRDMGQNEPYIPVVKYCRFAFKNDVVAPLNSDTLNPDAIDLTKAEGDWAKLVFKPGAILLNQFVDNLDLTACAIIVSNITDKKRSTSFLALANNILGLQWPAAEAYPTFGNVSTPIDVPSEVYLDNSASVAAGGEVSGVVKAAVPYIIPAEGDPIDVLLTEVPSEPTDCRVYVKRQGTSASPALSENIMVLDADDNIGAGSVTLVSRNWDQAASELDIEFSHTGTDAWAITGGYVICNGVKYTF